MGTINYEGVNMDNYKNEISINLEYIGDIEYLSICHWQKHVVRIELLSKTKQDWLYDL